jgi:hypothetical protein
LVAIPWLIQEIGQREGGVNDQEVELVLLFACSADCPRSPCGLSARHGSAGCSSCSSCVLERFRFDLFCRLFWAGRGFAYRLLGRRDSSVRHELLADRSRIGSGSSIFRVRHRGSVAFVGPSAATSRTVRCLHTDRLPGHHGLSARDFVDCLSPLLLECRFCFGIAWGLFLVLVGPL